MPSGEKPSSPANDASTGPGGSLPSSSTEGVRTIPLARIRPCPFQPRKEFSTESLEELAASIREQGILQPLIVRNKDDHYELIAGERRWRAAQLAGLTEVPALLRVADDREVIQLALVENLQRDNLNPLEEALGYTQLIEQFDLRQEDVAAKVGKSRTVVANALRLLKLPEQIQAYLRDGRLSVGHAKVVLGLNTPQEQTVASECILKDGLNVRQTEELVALMQSRDGTTPVRRSGKNPIAARDPHVASLETRLRERFGTKVQLQYRQGQGAVQIRFYNDSDLERILEIVGVAAD
jgi:ParB family transcriptional regulator, chromosome partitioning protein